MVIYHTVEPQSREWFLLRLGIPTASEFHKIVTPTGKISKQSDDYAHTLLAELMLGHPIDDDMETQWMQRGTELEDSAIKAYEFEVGETQRGGFVTVDDGSYGCSPDRLVGEVGILEIKCPKPNTHIGYLLSRSAEQEKTPQIQGQLLVTGRQWVDLMSYHPELPPLIVRVERDEKYIALLGAALREFVGQLAEMRKLLEDRYGPFPDPWKEPETVDGLDVSDEDVAAMVARGVCVPAGEDF
jgi:hypothetical protein